MAQIGIASDHAGFALKEHLKKFFETRGIGYVDYGTTSEDSCDYPDYAHALAKGIEQGDCEKGVAICGSGQGIAMTLNKHAHIRAAIAWIPEIASLARQHNNANVLVLPGRFISNEEAEACFEIFMKTAFEGGRHQQRVDKISF
ncbi:MAG: ribose 5-phosphate isomerase B [Alloprevotella sp.]|nr:ribose 5-phosphate isomerase B [Bacteroidales bacterium]MDY3944341.1 ribose 5-phosphate isomerase B [Alloprevotella sp.]